MPSRRAQTSNQCELCTSDTDKLSKKIRQTTLIVKTTGNFTKKNLLRFDFLAFWSAATHPRNFRTTRFLTYDDFESYSMRISQFLYQNFLVANCQVLQTQVGFADASIIDEIENCWVFTARLTQKETCKFNYFLQNVLRAEITFIGFSWLAGKLNKQVMPTQLNFLTFN